MWLFKPKPKPVIPEPIIWKVPHENQVEFCTLFDTMQSEDKTLSRLKFWRFVTGIIPEEYVGMSAVVEFRCHKPIVKITPKHDTKR